MFDVIAFGSATNDVFLRLPENEIKVENKIQEAKRFLCLALGNKVLVDDMQVFSGGGGTNVSCSLSSLGFKTAYCGKVGKDGAGRIVLDDLAKFKVSTSLCLKEKSLATAISFILSVDLDRTILVFRGACHFLSKEELNFSQLKDVKWFYLAPFYEKTAELFGDLVEFAKDNDVKVAANPSVFQIEKEGITEYLNKVDILFLNQEEAALLAKMPVQQDAAVLAKAISRFCSGVIVVTKGEKGVLVFDGERFFKAGVYAVAVADKTGAGDSFAAGFLAGLLQENNIEYAIRLAIVNSGRCISQLGAKNGFLKQAELKLLPSIDIIKERVY